MLKHPYLYRTSGLHEEAIMKMVFEHIFNFKTKFFHRCTVPENDLIAQIQEV